MSNISVLLEKHQSTGFLATALGIPNCVAQGETRETAIDHLRKLLIQQFPTPIALEIYDEHPLVKLSGIFQNDPEFPALLEFIEADRHALDKAMRSQDIHNATSENSAA